MKALYSSPRVDTHSYLHSDHSRSAPATTPNTQSKTRTRYQLHLWISQKEYSTLKAIARKEDEPMTRIVRRLIRNLQPQI